MNWSCKSFSWYGNRCLPGFCEHPGKVCQRGGLDVVAQRVGFRARVDHEPALGIKIRAGAVEALPGARREASLDFDGPQPFAGEAHTRSISAPPVVR